MEERRVREIAKWSESRSSTPLRQCVWVGFFSNFSSPEKVRRFVRQSSARVHGHSSSPELSADQVARGCEDASALELMDSGGPCVRQHQPSRLKGS